MATMMELSPLRGGLTLGVFFLLTSLALPAAAQDMDGDGVPDSRDVCPTTSMGLSVDGAGCDAYCEVVDATTDVFLRSRLLEVGTAAAASFGASTVPPAGWHARAPGGRLGFVADPDRTDWMSYKGDFFVPGTPEEGFGMSVGGTSYFNSTLMSENGIPGSFTGTRAECRPLVCGQRGGGAVFWSGTRAGIDVDHTYSVLNEGLFILVEVTLTNTNILPRTVTYFRNVDPDNMQPVTGDYDTQNTIVSQGDGSATSIAHVSATTTGPDSYLALISNDPDARVSTGGFSNRSGNAIWDCTGPGFLCTPGATRFADEAVSLAVRKTIPGGGSVTFSYAYTLDAVEVATASACTTPSTCGDSVIEGTESCDDGNTMPGDGCDSSCAIETGYDCMGSPSMCAPICGDGMVLMGEGCDDGNTMPGDGCDASCAVETGYACSGMPSMCSEVCGDGVVTMGEGCDDGNTMPGDGCGMGCTVESGYSCMGSPSSCMEVCGDGVVTMSEGCDDSNTTGGDGCSATCGVEPGYSCAGSPSACGEICGDGLVVGAEGCDDGGILPGDGCSATCTVEPGYGCMGAPSMCSPVCGDGAIIAPETCDDANTTGGDGCSASCMTEPGFVCTGAPSSCARCVDTMAGMGTDLGCMMASPYCIGSGTSAFCASCEDDTSGGTDLGCGAASPVCDTSGAPTHVCVACEDDATGTGVDNGCSAATPVCGTTMAGAPGCFECAIDDHCGVGTVCDPSGSCVPGCTDDTDCAGTPATPVCDVSTRMCAECLTAAECAGTEICGAMNTCESIDTDGDLVPDERDDDDDNDGIPDAEEIDPALLGDSNGNGILDYEDAALVMCTDAGGDGVCDELPMSIDFDGDGIANHLDLDADGDGIADLVEGGGVDMDGDGRADAYVDADGDGLHDPYLAAPLPLPSSDGDASPDFLDRDADGDGLSDTLEAGGTDVDGDGVPDGATDGDDDEGERR